MNQAHKSFSFLSFFCFLILTACQTRHADQVPADWMVKSANEPAPSADIDFSEAPAVSFNRKKIKPDREKRDEFFRSSPAIGACLEPECYWVT